MNADELASNQGPEASEDLTGDKENTSASETSAPGDLDIAIFAVERARDAKANQQTQPPEDECVTFRSVTIVEMYAGQTVSSLTAALSAMKWMDTEYLVADRIIRAQRDYMYSEGNFWFVADPKHIAHPASHVLIKLPQGIDRIYCLYYVIGPSLIALVLTFILAADESVQIDTVLRTDVESRLDREGGFSGIKSVRDVKKERIRDIREEMEAKCRSWIKGTMPGTLSTAHDGIGAPTCALISLAKGIPFTTGGDYMALIDLARDQAAYRFSRYDFLYFTFPIDVDQSKEMTCAFNEGLVVAQRWESNLSRTPEIFHQAIFPLMIAEGIHAVLYSYQPRLNEIRDSLNKLDFGKAKGREIISLRTRLLEITPEILSICKNVTVLLDDAVDIWSNLDPLEPLRLSPARPRIAITAATRQRQLRAAVAALESEEANLRELIVVTSTSKSDTMTLQLTRRITWLTIWLVVLTVILVALGLLTIYVTSQDNPIVHVQVTVPSHPTSTVAPSPSNYRSPRQVAPSS